MNFSQHQSVKTARVLLELGYSLDQVLQNPLIPSDLKERVRDEINRDENFQLVPAHTLVSNRNKEDWLRGTDRTSWHYWPALRQFLIAVKGLDSSTVRSLDDSSDRILRQIADPHSAIFDIRGLVLGHVQSGKTANYTAVIAKAADAGYRLVIVLSGCDNGLRRQTNLRLKRELVGYSDNRPRSVRLPPIGKHWHEFTRCELDGDFQPGYANHAALQGSQPVLLVIKKFGPILRRLRAWLLDSPSAIKNNLPVLIIDDEADLASIDTKGSYQIEDEPLGEDYEPPSITNGLIRELIKIFDKCSYVAYTATPFANILIPHDTNDPSVGNDLYPKDFIVDLPRPQGYFGAENYFGRMSTDPEAEIGGLDVIRDVNNEDLEALAANQLPPTLGAALIDFILAGAARAQRGSPDDPATMLIHPSHLVQTHSRLKELVENHFYELRDEWRYQRTHSLRNTLKNQWNTSFAETTRNLNPDLYCDFEAIEPFIGTFIDSVQIRAVNSKSGEVLDYEREPSLKAIAIGGNSLSRGLTLENLLVSYFIRRAANYDTLMQMGRWFGFRGGYEDLTRLYTTSTLADWFQDLAFVEHRLREDIQIYESMGLTPFEVGMRIWQHPTMQVTSRLKRRFASTTTLSQSYSLTLEQTFKFPLRNLERLAYQAQKNLAAVTDLVQQIGPPSKDHSDKKGPVWNAVQSSHILRFLESYVVDGESSSMSPTLIRAFISRMRDVGELTSWTVAIRGRESRHAELGTTNWGVANRLINQISRSRIRDSESVGVITSPGDELLGLTPELQEKAWSLVDQAKLEGRKKSINVAARESRPCSEGLLLLYPISKYSKPNHEERGVRRPLFETPSDKHCQDLVGVAISFPPSNQPQRVEAFLQGTVEWRPAD